MGNKKYQANRRSFLQTAGAFSAGALILPQWGCKEVKKDVKSGDRVEVRDTPTRKRGLDKFGIQLYTLRDEMPKNPLGVIKQVASFGYQQIEGYEGEQGLWWNMPHKDFKKFLDDTGVEMVSSHSNIHENFDEKAAQAAAVGLDYLICPYIGPQKSVEEWKKVTDLFNECGAICKKNGIRFAYHNHAYTFKAFSGMIPQDFLMENTDPDLVDHQMDMYWVVTGGAKPVEYLEKYPNRFKLCHVKDRMKDAPADEQNASCILGTGSIDYPSILKFAADKGMKYFILEQERYDGSTPLESAEIGAQYLKNLVFT